MSAYFPYGINVNNHIIVSLIRGLENFTPIRNKFITFYTLPQVTYIDFDRYCKKQASYNPKEKQVENAHVVLGTG
jgi:hypothetical protein